MEDIIKNCIESRKTAIYCTYTGDNPQLIEKIENYFKKMEEFAKNCSDVSDFESKFATSPLAQEYTDLFTEIMSEGTKEESLGGSVAKDIGTDIADSMARRARRQARQEVYDQVRDVPGIGQALEVKQYADFFGRFRKKKDD